MYFMYEVTCEDCTIIVGLQSFSHGDPDLYINYGDEKLPEKERHDFESTATGSEVLTIDKSHPFFNKNRGRSMKNIYTIAVYGRSMSTFILSAS